MSTPIIGVGASAGGLEALREVFSVASSGLGMAFVVVQHLDPNHESLMAQLIERQTDLSVNQAKGGETIEADHVYVIPPGFGLAIEDGVLRLTEFSDPRGLRRPIDDFFESLAKDQCNLAACVILSGTGADGSRGLRAIKENGGLCIAQDPDTARYDGMPLSAIATGLVDMIVPPPQVISALKTFFDRSADTAELVDEADEISAHVDDLCTIIRDALGHDFSNYKPATLNRRIARRMQVLGIHDAGEYVERIRSDNTECSSLFRDLLINVTRFFRDTDEFSALRDKVIEPMVSEARDGQDIRIWVPGCSSGEEAYTIAMLFDDAMHRHNKKPRVQIFATDIDDKMLDIARSATYPLVALNDIPPNFRSEYISGGANTITVVPRIADMCRFSLHNVISDPPFSKIDLLTCRNLLIYFDDTLQKQILPMFHFSLAERGSLFLGPSEGIGRFDDLFETIDRRARLFRRRAGKSKYALQIREMPRIRRKIEASKPPKTQKPGLPNIEVEALQRIAERYAPVSLLTDDEGYLMEKWGPAGRYLEFPNRLDRRVHVPALAREGLRELIGPLLREVRSTSKRAVARDVTIVTDFGSIDAAVLCEPIDETGFLFLIKETGALQPFDGDDIAQFDVADRQTQFLEDELQATRDRLRSTVEELETTNEELKSSNEEMMSMNEELQSTNEELTTVNEELKSKIEQLMVANADLQNFFDSTELMIVVLDADMKLRSFTNAARKIFPVTESDIGQPLDNLSGKLSGQDYGAALVDAARHGQASELRLHTQDGDRRELLARITPYRRLDGKLDGATMVIADVTDTLSLEQNLREERERLRLALDVAKVGIWEYEPSTDRTFLDSTERALLGIKAGENADTLEPILDKLPSDDRARVNTSLRLAMDGSRDFDEVFRLPLEDGTDRWLHGLGRIVADDNTRKFIGVTYDVTTERDLLSQRELMIREMNHRVKNLFAVIAAMVSISARGTDNVQELSQNLRGRIHALGRSHALTSDGSVELTATLRDLLEKVMTPTLSSQRMSLEGEDVPIARSQITSLALIFHEWATNSVKYGALSNSDGTLDVRWDLNGSQVELTWLETGQSPSDPDVKAGFGTTLIEATARQLQGKVSGTATAQGYRRTLTFKLEPHEELPKLRPVSPV